MLKKAQKAAIILSPIVFLSIPMYAKGTQTGHPEWGLYTFGLYLLATATLLLWKWSQIKT